MSRLSHKDVPCFDVKYVDNHLLVAVKPAGLVIQPNDTDDDNFLDRAKKWIKCTYQKTGNVFLEPIHRIDKPVSGLILFARTSKALRRLQASLRDKQISKTYIALIEGDLSTEEGVLEDCLTHESYRARVVSSANAKGKRARLQYRLLRFAQKRGTKKRINLVEISLETGRYHQIRAQFAHIGCPVLGDSKYGSKLKWKENAIALHHAKMTIKHPVLNEDFTFEAPYTEMVSAFL